MSCRGLENGRGIPEGVNAINDLWEIFLLVQVRELKDKALESRKKMVDIESGSGKNILREDQHVEQRRKNG